MAVCLVTADSDAPCLCLPMSYNTVSLREEEEEGEKKSVPQRKQEVMFISRQVGLADRKPDFDLRSGNLSSTYQT